MNRTFKTIIILFLSLTLFSRAVISVDPSGSVYNVRYSVVSNGSDAFIHLLILEYVPYNPPLLGGQWNGESEPLWAEEFLLFFDGSRLYRLNFTPTFGTPHGTYEGASFVNESWYLMVKISGTKRFYRFNAKNFCVEPLNVSWFWLPRGKTSNEINGWRVELQPGPGEWGYANVSEVWVTMSKNASIWSLGPAILTNSSVFPVYFTLRKGNLTRNITLVYLNLNVTRDNYVPPNTSGVPSYWFPSDVKIVNVTVCKISANTSTSMAVETNGTTYTTKTSPNTTKTQTNTKETKKGICGPAFLLFGALAPACVRKMRRWRVSESS
ncbi:hypothetical protein E3E36_09465 [Thermococcus sp. M36]|uniref:hypothetical protein n=1 Tax=Thermococcus sp. M36 TaxID=1638261 RepID=UPI00143B66E1|nr:hypothetical protein [Thermococcus sp. M36]NJE06368.1 hypothetical protein [Thermococcus sp. M36]